jgi:hypothetical protein
MNDQVQGSDEMGALDGWLQTVRQTFVEAKNLLQTVRDLRTELDGIKVETDRLRQTNATLEENLAWHRGERDRLERENRSMNDQLRTSEAAKVVAQQDTEHWQSLASESSIHLARTARERDDALLRVMELEDKVKELEAFRDNVSAAFHKVRMPLPAEEAPKPSGQPRTETGQFGSPAVFHEQPQETTTRTSETLDPPEPVANKDWQF